jgi:hypothetical protein
MAALVLTSIRTSAGAARCHPGPCRQGRPLTFVLGARPLQLLTQAEGLAQPHARLQVRKLPLLQQLLRQAAAAQQLLDLAAVS